MPSDSRFAEAVAEDEELAESTIFDEPTFTPPRLSSWGPIVAELRTVNERLGAVAQLVAVLSKNRYEPPALPRPVTARDKVKSRLGEQRHRRIVAQLLPPEEVTDAVSG